MRELSRPSVVLLLAAALGTHGEGLRTVCANAYVGAQAIAQARCPSPREPSRR